MTAPGRGPRKRPPTIAPPEGSPEPLISLSSHEGPLAPDDLFGRRAPLEIEIGTGKGHTLVTLGERHPETNFLGIEVGFRWARLTRYRVIQAGRTNVRLVAGEAQWVLSRYLPEASVRCVHVYFPDPWPKKRHAKRRLFRAGFPDLLRRCLTGDGEVRVATDHASYGEQIREVMTSGGFVEVADAVWPEDPVSAFEAKYRVQGRPIYRAVFRPASG